jgi:hypothetical protein
MHKVLFLLATSSILLVSSAAQAQPGAFATSPQGSMQGNAPATDAGSIRQWFASYDSVRKAAQMSPEERNRADGLLSKGLSVFVPGPEKMQAQKLLTGLVGKYQMAVEKLKQLPYYGETAQLHQAYFNYFSQAQGLFSDYLRVQDNIMAKDQNGRSIMADLMGRKAALEQLEAQCKAMDAAARAQFGIKAF